MRDWKEVVQNKELLSKAEELIDKVGYTFHNFPQDICDQLNQLTGNEWTGDAYVEYCAEYWDSPWTLEEVVYALFHDGDLPDKKEEDVYAWNIGETIGKDEEVIPFFCFGKYREQQEITSKYEKVDAKQLYRELIDAFPKWNNLVESWEEDDYESFCCSNKETYAYEKEIYINNSYEKKFLKCILTNMNEQEKDTFIKIVQKYCNHVAADSKRCTT